MVRFLHAFALVASLFHFAHEGGDHTPHGAHIDIELVLRHINSRRHIARAL